MQSLTSRLEGFIALAASPSPPAAPAPASPATTAAAPPQPPPGAIFLACLLRSGPPGLYHRSFPESPTSPAREASSALLKIRQGRRRVVDYALEFRTLAADSGWNETSIISALSWTVSLEEVKDFLAPLDTPRDFESLVEIASRIDSRLRERERERRPAGSQVFGVPGGAALLPSPDTTCDPIPDHSDYPDLSKVPPCYYDLKEVFNKTKATSLPPHLKNRYPLPLISSAFELLQQAKVFTKLDLRNAYHLVRIREGDEWKTGFNTPSGHYEYLVMPFGLTKRPSSVSVVLSFLGYVITANHISMDPAKVDAVTNWPPLTSKKKWNDKAEEAFNKLKQKFTTAPILTVPDPALRFVVGVDASNEGIGAVLSQRLPADNRIHPCAFLSRKLSAAERNYDVGNKELLAVKVALEEWRHWLEGAEQPFIVWTDHKNLKYLKSAKRLNSRQARWAHFSLAGSGSPYRTGPDLRTPSQRPRPVPTELYEPEPTAEGT
ncbi:hypothetical protein L3Q82_009125 [Scortum barcoo]|uniref:Uncharacterized protein n=1 Tax=Scortum barcoo TaxID=214431 RepID=A0ACB8XED9_9TELE|nr:hypothetical protein L3Q82_009125 [Scortum barcoo]